jgi:hypothetical protein
MRKVPERKKFLPCQNQEITILGSALIWCSVEPVARRVVASSLWLDIGAQRRHDNHQIKALPDFALFGTDPNRIAAVEF